MPRFQIPYQYLMFPITSPIVPPCFPVMLHTLISQPLSAQHCKATRYFKPEPHTSSPSLFCYSFLISCPVVFIFAPHSCLFICSLCFILPPPPPLPPYHPPWQQKHGVGCCSGWRGKERGLLFQPVCWHAYRTAQSDPRRCLNHRELLRLCSAE